MRKSVVVHERPPIAVLHTPSLKRYTFVPGNKWEWQGWIRRTPLCSARRRSLWCFVAASRVFSTVGATHLLLWLDSLAPSSKVSTLLKMLRALGESGALTFDILDLWPPVHASGLAILYFSRRIAGAGMVASTCACSVFAVPRRLCQISFDFFIKFWSFSNKFRVNQTIGGRFY